MSLASRIVRRAGTVAVISPAGELRRGSVDVLTQAVEIAVATDVENIVISFTKVTALLSQGIQTLVILRDKATEADKTLYVTDLAKDVHYTLKITNLLEFLNHKETLESVLAIHGEYESDLQPLEPK